jgi:hypothetical protein
VGSKSLSPRTPTDEIVAPLLGSSRASGCRVRLVHVANLLLDSEAQALDWFSGLLLSCATQQRAERTR